MDSNDAGTSSRFSTSDEKTAVLTSFRTLPDEDANGYNGVADPSRLTSGDGLEENVDRSSDPYLVQVTRVETYIDDEEDATGLQRRSEQPKNDCFHVFQHKHLNIVKSRCIYLK